MRRPAASEKTMNRRSESMSVTLEYMLKNNLQLNARTFVELNWFGERTVRQLEGEDRIEVQEFRDEVKKLRRKK
jgi:hypothetical protein